LNKKEAHRIEVEKISCLIGQSVTELRRVSSGLNGFALGDESSLNWYASFITLNKPPYPLLTMEVLLNAEVMKNISDTSIVKYYELLSISMDLYSSLETFKSNSINYSETILKLKTTIPAMAALLGNEVKFLSGKINSNELYQIQQDSLKVYFPTVNFNDYLRLIKKTM
jgi:hypothetical protein